MHISKHHMLILNDAGCTIERVQPYISKHHMLILNMEHIRIMYCLTQISKHHMLILNVLWDKSSDTWIEFQNTIC